jgi:hypothetical protein
VMSILIRLVKDHLRQFQVEYLIQLMAVEKCLTSYIEMEENKIKFVLSWITDTDYG